MKIIIPGVWVAAKHTRDSITMAIIIVHKFHEKGNSFLYYCLIFQWHCQLQLVTWLVMICIYTDPIYRPKSQITLWAYYWQGTFLKSRDIIKESLFEKRVKTSIVIWETDQKQSYNVIYLGSSLPYGADIPTFVLRYHNYVINGSYISCTDPIVTELVQSHNWIVN